jgi:hypothetical protein
MGRGRSRVLSDDVRCTHLVSDKQARRLPRDGARCLKRKADGSHLCTWHRSLEERRPTLFGLEVITSDRIDKGDVAIVQRRVLRFSHDLGPGFGPGHVELTVTTPEACDGHELTDAELSLLRRTAEQTLAMIVDRRGHEELIA